MANDKDFKVKNGIQPTVYHEGVGTVVSGSVGYSLSSASYDSKSFSVASQDTNPYGCFFKPDGTKMYMVGDINNSVYQYSLSTSWDVSTASYDSVIFSIGSQEALPTGIFFKPDGSKMYISGQGGDDLNQYSLSTAWDISTATYTNVSLDVTGVATNPYQIAFKPDGIKMFVISPTTDGVFQYSTVGYTQTLDLATGGTFSFTLSNATTVSFSNPPASGTATGFALEVVNTGGYALTWPSSVKWHLGAAPTATATKELYTFVTTDGGTTYYGKLAGSDIA